VGGENERQLLSFIGNDAMTIRPLRAYLEAALDQSKRPPVAGQKKFRRQGRSPVRAGSDAPAE
jgi:hypothetical protein